MDLNWESKRTNLFIVSLLLLSLFPFLILPGNNEAIASQHRLSIVSETGESRIADIAERTINGVVNISSTKVIQANNQQFI